MPTPKEGYRLKDGTKVPGVTTVLGRFKESGGLLHWAFERGAAGAKSLYDERQKAADIGTAAHALVEAHIKGASLDALTMLPSADYAHIFEGLTTEQTSKAMGAFDAYMTWARHSRLEVVHTEVRLVSEEYRFGGTPDAIGRIDGALCLLDWKTSNKVYPEYWIQLAAYIELWEDDFTREALSGAHLIRFGKELGDFSHSYRPRDSLDLEWAQFRTYLEAYERDKILKKRAA